MKAITLIASLCLLFSMNTAIAQNKTQKDNVLPMQVLDLRKMTDKEKTQWIVINGRKDMPVIVEVSGANTEEFWITVGKTMRGLQHGGLSNLVLVRTNDAQSRKASEEVIWLYEKGKVSTVFENPPNDTRLKSQIQKKVVILYDRVHGTKMYQGAN